MVSYVPMVMYGKLYENIPHMLGNRWLALILNSVEVGLDTGLQIFFKDWWAEVTHGANNGKSFSEMMGPSVSN